MHVYEVAVSRVYVYTDRAGHDAPTVNSNFDTSKSPSNLILQFCT